MAVHEARIDPISSSGSDKHSLGGGRAYGGILVEPWRSVLYNGSIEEAARSYDEALELDPGNVNLWNRKGYAFGILGRYEDAQQARKGSGDKLHECRGFELKGPCPLQRIRQA